MREQINDTITAGGTAQEALTAEPYRKYLLVQNNSDEALWINFQDEADEDVGIKIAAGGSGEWEYETMPQIVNAMSIFGATTGSKFGITTDSK